VKVDPHVPAGGSRLRNPAVTARPAHPRITYAELARELRQMSEQHEHITHRSRELYAALCEVADECRRLGLPSLAALVVRADSRRPGDAYYQGMSPELRYRGEQIEAWRQELEAVKQAVYPPGRARTEAEGGS
jgi:hypothetical protein